MNLQQQFQNSNLTYADVAHELGTCELTARNKINGKTKITKAERQLLEKLFMQGEKAHVRHERTESGI